MRDQIPGATAFVFIMQVTFARIFPELSSQIYSISDIRDPSSPINPFEVDSNFVFALYLVGQFAELIKN